MLAVIAFEGQRAQVPAPGFPVVIVWCAPGHLNNNNSAVDCGCLLQCDIEPEKLLLPNIETTTIVLDGSALNSSTVSHITILFVLRLPFHGRSW